MGLEEVAFIIPQSHPLQQKATGESSRWLFVRVGDETSLSGLVPSMAW